MTNLNIHFLSLVYVWYMDLGYIYVFKYNDEHTEVTFTIIGDWIENHKVPAANHRDILFRCNAVKLEMEKFCPPKLFLCQRKQ
jgi:hypothetical protein